MLIHVGEERNGAIDRSLAAALSTIAGALNAVGFLVAATFTANMTGNVSALADEVARGAWRSSLGLLLLLALFVAGAALAAAVIAAGEQRGLRSIYATAIAAEGAVVLALGLALAARKGALPHMALVGGLSVVMGFQNAVTSMISRSRVRTTHVSGMATDIGIGLAALLSPGRRAEALPKLGLHALTLTAFLLGGIGGALLHAWIGVWLFTLAGACLLAIALPEMLRARRLPG